MTTKVYLKGAILTLLIATSIQSCDAPPDDNKAATPDKAAAPATSASPQFTDSIIAAVKTDTAYKVTQAMVDKGILRIAVSNPNEDVVGHFNIHYDLHISRVPLSEDSVAMLKSGITGLAIYTNSIGESQLYKDLVWETPQQ